MTDTNGDHQESEPEDLDQPVFSLVTGKYRHAKRYHSMCIRGSHPHLYSTRHAHYPTDTEPDSTSSDPTSSAVVLRNQDTALSVMPDSAAGQFLQERSWRGLETRLGEDAPSVLEQGRSGIARGYKDDHRS